jgi:hypothetical protein
MINKLIGLIMGYGRFHFSKDDLLRILREAAFAGGGALALGVLGGLATLDFGVFQSFATMMIPVAINAVNRWLRNNNINK